MPPPKGDDTKANVNTILLGITMAILGWVGVTVYSTSLAIARMEERVIAMSEEIKTIKTRLTTNEQDILNIRLSALKSRVEGNYQAQRPQGSSSP